MRVDIHSNLTTDKNKMIKGKNSIRNNALAPLPTDKICIIVYGNIASGKSTFSKNLLQKIPGYKYVCLDQIRLDYYKAFPEINSIARERKCEEECLKQILESRLLIYETTAATLFFNRIKMRLKGHFKVIYVYINCPTYECAHRFDCRKRNGYKSIAPPFNNRMSISECISHFHEKHYHVKVDLELDTLKYTPSETIEKFILFCQSE